MAGEISHRNNAQVGFVYRNAIEGFSAVIPNERVAEVRATDRSDASFSNYGRCVDIWAPGVSILSTKKGGGTTTLSGTSMAAPHTGGAGALYLSASTGASPATVESALKTNAVTTGATSKNGAQIRLLYAGRF